ncbi:receptor-like protein kinase FERONIA [Vigna radiata var. radiata]|uniref:Receptor-like protein kinase FERONIA n=1 Tax=Vigna radiata var. radiata TaxID=3916 RepID=A0A1S3TX18_VIGRR|nr:receptor-like protein kinase FERONIA [Vigna radiata var. radiata]
MDTTCKQTALVTILLLFLLSRLPCLSMADVIYRPLDLFTISCGSSTNFSTLDTRNWTADINFLSQTHHPLAVPSLTPISRDSPYAHARLSLSPFTYSFPVTPGPKFLRLFFYSTSYPPFDRSKACFTVQAGPYTLLQHFNASLNADAFGNPGNPDILSREYCVTPKDGWLNITFSPSTTAQHPDSYAFINGIEIVSMPSYLYYTNPNVDIDGLPIPADAGNPFPIDNSFALETMYRLRVGDKDMSPAEDTGMLRTWDADKNYVTSPSVQSLDRRLISKLNFTEKTPNYTAPDEVYRSSRNMGPDGSANMRFNLTWQLPVDLDFTYLLRLHFCQLDPEINRPSDFTFYIYIQDRWVEVWANVLKWSGKQKGVPVVREYTVFMPPNQDKANLSLKMHPNPESHTLDAQINAIELFKINDSSGNLSGPNPSPFPKISDSNKKSSGTKRPLVPAVAGAVSAVVLLSFIVAFFVVKHKRGVAINKGSNKKDGTSRGGGSSSLPTNLCRHFSVADIRAATNNFDELLVVGVGGFGNVYKGFIDDGSTPVAIKRLKPGSQQGLTEFMNEIEMLSQLRHLHLVSLIGYCYESNEMILVYDFMDRGTLRDHLYGTDNPPLSWNQRLQICVGAARGLHYLHTGAKQMIIHRDVKSTNILLDEKWVAKVSDFGLSRIGPTGPSMTHVSTQVKGSVGYLDPEYYKRQRLTEKSDVYSYGVVLLEVLCGRQPLLRMVEKQQVSLVDWAKHRYQKGSLGEIVDPALKDQIAPHCLRKFGEVALSCLLEDGTQRPSMNDVVGVLEFVLQLQLQDSAHFNAVLESGGDYEDSGTENMFSSTHSSVHVSDYSNSSGLNTTSYRSKESDSLIPEPVFSEIKDPKGR